MPGVLGAVILYNPDDGIFEYVKTYVDELDHLLIIDNTESGSQAGDSLSQLHKNVTLIQNHENFGIARALNQAGQFAVANKFEWLMTMDQDSNFLPGSLERMMSFIRQAEVKPAILTPFHQTPQGRTPGGSTTNEVRMTMTSGNLLNLGAYAACGPFEEKLFIDSVDHEYCLRLRKAGYKIVRLNTSILNHRLGNVKYHRFMGMRFKTTNHSAQRKYYITRNRLYVMTKYFLFDFKFFRREFWELIKSFFTVLLLEDDKAKKITAMLRGVGHFATGRFGKI